MARIGIITLHHSYNCGSILQAYALQTSLVRLGHDVEIINFSNPGQMSLYSDYCTPDSIKSIIKNLLFFAHHERIVRNNNAYEEFISKHLNLNGPLITNTKELNDEDYDIVVAGSDQIWNITIEDGDDAYFLPWVKKAKKIAYAPSFGSKNPAVYANDPSYYARLICSFDHLSTREANGRRWIYELAGLDAPVIVDPTLLLDAEDYDSLRMPSDGLPDDYIFYYAPSYMGDINRLVKAISTKYQIPVIAFNSKTFFTKGMNIFSDFSLPHIESPSSYLRLISNASMVITTSFHGTIFAALHGKPFWTIKNGGMFGEDDRVLTLVGSLGISDRVIPIGFNPSFDYLASFDQPTFTAKLGQERAAALGYLDRALS